MIDVIRKIYYSDVGSGDFAEVTVESIQNFAVLIGNESTRGNSRTVVYKEDIDDLIEALTQLKEYL